MKLSQGEYVALEKIENMFSSAPIVGQVYVHGSSLESFLIAVLVPEPLQLAQLATNVLRKKLDEKNTSALEEVCKEPKIINAIMDILLAEAKKNGLKG